MNDTILALVVVSLLFAGYLRFLGRRASRAKLGRSAPGIRIPATTVCAHTWDVAQRAAAPQYTNGAIALLVVAVLTAGAAATDMTTTSIVVVWFVLAFGSELYFLSRAAGRATAAARAVRCEHQRAAPEPRRRSRHEAPPPRNPAAGRGARIASRKGRRRR